jgi:hypothetical protein
MAIRKVGSAGVLLAEEVVLHSMGVGHMLASSRLEHERVPVSAKGFEVMELVSGIRVAAQQQCEVIVGDTRVGKNKAVLRG